MGRLSAERGAVFQQINIGPYDIDEITKIRDDQNVEDANASNFERYAEFSEIIHQRWSDAMSRNFHNYTDDTDISDYKDKMESAEE